MSFRRYFCNVLLNQAQTHLANWKVTDGTPKKNFNVTKSVDGKRKSLSVNEPTTNLKSLISHAIVRDVESSTERHILVGKRVRHKYEETIDGETTHKWYTGRIISQVLVLTLVHTFKIVLSDHKNISF